MNRDCSRLDMHLPRRLLPVRPMSGHPLHGLFVGAVMFSVTAMAQAQEAQSRWRLRVDNLHHELQVEATIRLTDAAAASCMHGAWKRAVVEAKTAHDKKFFPIDEPLAYKLEAGHLTLGRTTLCDAYRFLSGKLEDSTIRGSYDAVSIFGGRKLGTFVLHRIP